MKFNHPHLRFILPVFILILMCGQQVHAQIGIKAGANFSGISYDQEQSNVDLGNRVSYQIGVFGDFEITPFFAVRPAVLYNTKGNQINFPDSLGEVKNTINYIDIPVNLAYKFKVGGIGMVLEAGPYFGIYVSGKSGNEDIPDDEINSTDIGLNGSLNFEFNHVGFGLGYSRGLGSLNAENDVLTLEGKNSVWTLFGLYLF